MNTTEYQYIHHPLNDKGTGLDLVADVYVAKNFDIRGKIEPSSEFRACASQASNELQVILNAITSKVR